MTALAVKRAPDKPALALVNKTSAAENEVPGHGDDDGGDITETDIIDYRLACLGHATECFVADSAVVGSVVDLARKMYDFVMNG